MSKKWDFRLIQNQFFRRIGCIFFVTTLFLSVFAHAADIHYFVEFEGLENKKALKSMEGISQLLLLQKKKPPSISALKHRAETDIPEWLKVLHAYGYYEAQIRIEFQEVLDHVDIFVLIDPGPIYEIESYTIRLHPSAPFEISLKEIGIEIGKPALTENILQSELKLLNLLSQKGFPLAHIQDRSFIVDGKTKGVRICIDVETKEQVLFGSLSISGLNKIKPLFIEQKTLWKEGEVYDSTLVEKTQTALLDSHLFSSVLITHEEGVGSNLAIPMKIEVSESKYKSIQAGISYQTVFGPGITFGWENRNVGKMGRLLSFQGDITRISHSGIAIYKHPDFIKIDQDYIWQAEASHESLYAYSMRSYGIMNRLERKIGEKFRFSLGLQGERLYVTASVQNGNYWLFELPLYVRFSTADNLLNPTKGYTLEYTTTGALNVAETKDFYLVNQFSESFYYSFDEKNAFIFAQQLTLGSILSQDLTSSPLCRRYLGGSEQDLRGYRYRSVSPFVDGKPIGGRSAIYLTLETRLRLTKTIGLVPFFDLGNVQKPILPSGRGKWYKSTGIGLRYFSFMGPFRIDLAFPLDRRKGVDPVYKILASIGQTF